MNREDIIKETRKSLKDLGIYRLDMEIGLDIYAQCYLDWCKTRDELEGKGKIMTYSNGNPGQTQEQKLLKDLAGQVLAWWRILFQDKGLKQPTKKVKTNKYND